MAVWTLAPTARPPRAILSNMAINSTTTPMATKTQILRTPRCPWGLAWGLADLLLPTPYTCKLLWVCSQKLCDGVIANVHIAIYRKHECRRIST